MEVDERINMTKSSQLTAFLIAAIAMVLAYLFADGLVELERRWSTTEEYSHGYMIPLVALFLFWQKVPALKALDWTPAWASVALMLLAIFAWCLGELSSLFVIVHYAIILALVALVLGIFGWLGLKASWASLAYLVFMIPLPVFLYRGLSANLQLISTELGVWFIRLFDISVFVSGNVIDLGVYQLQVVEACSGLSYLFPLMSFGFLIAYLYQGPLWQRWLIFLSTVPITIIMNSFRIGVIGVTVNYWGIEMAEGFLHAFEGWFIFMACLGILFLEVWIFSRFLPQQKPVAELIDFTVPGLEQVGNTKPGERKTRPTLVALLIVVIAALPLTIMTKERAEQIPERRTFAYFPLIKGDWLGRETAIEAPILRRLDLTDYIKADYRRSSEGYPVELYIAYYDSQRKGSAIHSPRACIPGGGWEISQLEQHDLGNLEGNNPFLVNRLVIAKGEYRQLVYYWFAQRGRIITNEYLAKFYLFWDALTLSRSDGALVRVITVVPEGHSLEDADERLQDFIDTFYPDISGSIPGR
jgi:exosortase D (VPLPA-CTERM-specific)